MITVREAAERLGISARRVRFYIASGRIPAKKFATVWMIKEKDLKKYKPRPPGNPTFKK
jgi:excisionase family DNA binding protein